MKQLAKMDKCTQVSVNEGIKRHGEKAIAAVLTEYSQLNDKKVLKPYMPSELSRTQKQNITKDPVGEFNADNAHRCQ